MWKFSLHILLFSLSSLFFQEGKTIKSSSGFSGKGFKFDETEHALANERKKLQKAALGLQDSDDEDGALDVSSGFITGYVIENLSGISLNWNQNAALNYLYSSSIY